MYRLRAIKSCICSVSRGIVIDCCRYGRVLMGFCVGAFDVGDNLLAGQERLLILMLLGFGLLHPKWDKGHTYKHEVNC